jgi:hypothetical protein
MSTARTSIGTPSRSNQRPRPNDPDSSLTIAPWKGTLTRRGIINGVSGGRMKGGNELKPGGTGRTFMRMTRKMTCALVAAGIAVSAPVAAASPAAAVVCSYERSNVLFGRMVTLWNCGGQYHGQIQGAAPGDSVEMQYFAAIAWFRAGLSVVQPGSTSANTGSIDLFGKACIYIGDRPGESVCT